MMHRILVLFVVFPALHAANDEFNRDTQSPMVWLHLRGKQHPQFLQESGSNSVIDVYVEQGPSVGHFNGLQVPQSNMIREVYESFKKVFPREEFAEFTDILKNTLHEYETSSAFTAYSTISGQPRCGEPRLLNATKQAIQQRHVTPYPGGASLPLLGMDLVGRTLSQLERANGPASAQVPGVALLTQNALKQVKGVIQSVVAATLTDIPPTIAPPAWNNQPFPCMPMVTGSNCFGAVLYPITIGDFVMADMTDNALNGVVASFPSYYRRHVGSTDDRTYQRCFKSYMSMQCASSFPVCTTVQARQAEVPFLGRGPMCFLHCIETLVSCPGLWVEDLEDICRHVSVPPVCSFANYRKDGPPQLTSFDESEGLPLACP